MIELLILLSLVCYRVCRFVIRDTLIDELRVKFGDWVLGPVSVTWRDKVYDLFHCPYCLSIWVAAGTVAVADQFTSVPMPVFFWLATAGASMAWWRLIESNETKE